MQAFQVLLGFLSVVKNSCKMKRSRWTFQAAKRAKCRDYTCTCRAEEGVGVWAVVGMQLWAWASCSVLLLGWQRASPSGDELGAVCTWGMGGDGVKLPIRGEKLRLGRKKTRGGCVYGWKKYICACTHLRNFYFAVLMKVKFLQTNMIVTDYSSPCTFSAHWFGAWMTLETTGGSCFSNRCCWHFSYSAKHSTAVNFNTII